jgi:hypothetical protein
LLPLPPCHPPGKVQRPSRVRASKVLLGALGLLAEAFVAKGTTEKLRGELAVAERSWWLLVLAHGRQHTVAASLAEACSVASAAYSSASAFGSSSGMLLHASRSVGEGGMVLAPTGHFALDEGG